MSRTPTISDSETAAPSFGSIGGGRDLCPKCAHDRSITRQTFWSRFADRPRYYCAEPVGEDDEMGPSLQKCDCRDLWHDQSP